MPSPILVSNFLRPTRRTWRRRTTRTKLSKNILESLGAPGGNRLICAVAIDHPENRAAHFRASVYLATPNFAVNQIIENLSSRGSFRAGHQPTPDRSTVNKLFAEQLQNFRFAGRAAGQKNCNRVGRNQAGHQSTFTAVNVNEKF